MKIGVFDSGLGGLTIVKTMLENLHGAEIVYIADTANAPYGEKTQKQI
ncbi:MAG: glutamate racemase, partial [Campylobacterales bacterium]|nr:glutamate racemase [Campylobacterales bacterium]